MVLILNGNSEIAPIQLQHIRSDLVYLRWKLINVVYLLFSAQAEFCGGLSKLGVAAAPLERRKGDTQHLLVSTSGEAWRRDLLVRVPVRDDGKLFSGQQSDEGFCIRTLFNFCTYLRARPLTPPPVIVLRLP